MLLLISWLVRYGHVLGAALWVGGYALLAFFIIPLTSKVRDEALIQRAIAIERALTYVGTFTMIFGIILITRTRGFGNLLGSLWGALIITAFVLAVALLGIGDSGLRPALKRVKEQGEAPARRWAIIGFVLAVLTVGVMTGATYVI